MIQRRNTATKRQTLLHCGALAAILGVVVGLIFLVHPGCVYGAQTDWSVPAGSASKQSIKSR